MVPLSWMACVDAPRRPADLPTATRAALARSYSPGASPTDRQIAETQARIQKQSDDVEAYLDLARLMMRRRRETSQGMLMIYAQDAVKAALQLVPDHPEAILLRGLGKQYDHDFVGARAAGMKALATDPAHVTALLLVGDASLELGDYEDALTAYQRALDAEPDLRVYNRAAHISWLHGEIDEAMEFLDMAIDAGSVRDPESTAWCFVDLGEMYRHQGDAARAEASARRALELMKDYVPGLTLLARAQAQAGRRKDALLTYDQVLVRLPTVETLLEQAELWEAEGQQEKMQERIQQAIALSEDDPRPMAHFWARRNERPQDALRLAQKELKARRNVAAWDTLALALMRNGRMDEARAALDRAQARSTPLAELRLHHALWQVEAGHLDEARKTLEAVQVRNASADLRLTQELIRRLNG